MAKTYLRGLGITGLASALVASLIASTGCQRVQKKDDALLGDDLEISQKSYLTVSGASAPDKKERADEINEFALKMASEIRKTGDVNYLFSPLSLQAAFSTLYAGISDDFAARYAAALGFDPVLARHQEKMHGYLLDLQSAFAKPAAPEFELVNDSFLAKGFTVNADFLDANKIFYNIGVYRLDFAGDPEGARAKINGRVASLTNGLIKALLGSDDVSDRTRLVLTNAIYFKGIWERPFSRSATSDEEFTKASGEKKQVRMMRSQREIEFAERADYDAVSLDYENSPVSMAILLPKRGKSLGAVESSLSASEWRQVLEGLDVHDVVLGVPRFTLRNRMKNPEQILTSMGLEELFNPAGRPLNKISAEEPGLFIDKVNHEAVMIVDEAGTEAAAATSISGGMGAAPPKEQPREFVVDRPALFVLYDKASGGMMFLGRIGDPDSH